MPSSPNRCSAVCPNRSGPTDFPNKLKKRPFSQMRARPTIGDRFRNLFTTEPDCSAPDLSSQRNLSSHYPSAPGFFQSIGTSVNNSLAPSPNTFASPPTTSSMVEKAPASTLGRLKSFVIEEAEAKPTRRFPTVHEVWVFPDSSPACVFC